MLNYEKVKVNHGKDNTFKYYPIANPKFSPVLGKHLGKAQHTGAMEQTLENYDFGLKDANVKILKKTTDKIVKPNKCSQCN